MAQNSIYIPYFVANERLKPTKVLPRLYFYNGLKQSQLYFVEGFGATTGSVQSKSLESFPYFDYYNDNTPNTGSKSILFQNEQAVYGVAPNESLYSEYWETYIELLYNPRTRLLNCSAIIPLADYFEMELNDIVQFRGNHYHLRAINDYNLSSGECNLQLLGPIISDTLNIREQCLQYSILGLGDDFDLYTAEIRNCQTGGIETIAGYPIDGTAFVCSRGFPKLTDGAATITVVGACP